MVIGLRVEMSLALRDIDIRLPLHDWLWRAHSPPDDTVILHELSIPRPSARVDLAVVNGAICGFEIKSDVDGLSRLPRQVRAFNAVFDRVSIVTTERHATRAQRLIPPWWGILAPLEDGEFEQLQQSNPNPERDTVAVLHMLTCEELLSILDAHTLLRGLKSKPKKVLIRAIVDLLSPDETLFGARYTLKKRARIS